MASTILSLTALILPVLASNLELSRNIRMQILAYADVRQTKRKSKL